MSELGKIFQKKSLFILKKNLFNIIFLYNYSPLHPSTCESVALHFIAIKESLHMIELVQLVDNYWLCCLRMLSKKL